MILSRVFCHTSSGSYIGIRCSSFGSYTGIRGESIFVYSVDRWVCYWLTTYKWILFISACIRRCCTRLRSCLFFLVLLHFSHIASSNSIAVIFLGLGLQLHEQSVGMSWLHTEIRLRGRKISSSLHCKGTSTRNERKWSYEKGRQLQGRTKHLG